MCDGTRWNPSHFLKPGGLEAVAGMQVENRYLNLASIFYFSVFPEMESGLIIERQFLL